LAFCKEKKRSQFTETHKKEAKLKKEAIGPPCVTLENANKKQCATFL
jgi:hypothetical protein